MKNKLSVFIISGSLALGLYFIMSSSSAPAGNDQDSHAKKSANILSQTKDAIKKTLSFQSSPNVALTQAPPVVTPYDISLKNMTQLMADSMNENMDSNDFIKRLQSYGLRTIVGIDQQDFIADMTMVRTEKGLPGLRYIHAQFEGPINNQHLQHFSFEIPKGVGAQEKAIQFIKSVIPLDDAKKIDTDPSMIAYRHNGKVIWAKKLGPDDLDDPINAHDKNDIGNIKVAIEDDIHPDSDDHGDEH